MRETLTDVVVTPFPEPYKPWEFVSTRDELGEWIRKLWAKMEREELASDWSDREKSDLDKPWRKYTMTIDPEDKALVFTHDDDVEANPAGSEHPFKEKKPKIHSTFGQPGSKM